jgi:hypothetical protein
MNDKGTSWIRRPLLFVSILFLLAGCGGGGGGGAVNTGSGGGVQGFTATIVSPSGNVQINQGDAVEFSGNASGGTAPYKYLWSFSGAAPSSTAQNPGSVTFNAIGTFTVVFQVTDATGVANAVSASVTVTVIPTGVNTTPQASITSPSTNVTITAGQSVSFAGSAAGGESPITYLWTFGGAAADSALQNPGPVTFASAGTYTVTFRVTDTNGDTTAATRVVTVTSQGGSVPPTAAITSPANGVTITAGQSLAFQGTAVGGRTPLTYLWHFGGAISDSTLLNPGAILFSAAGTYTVTFTVTDADARQSVASILVHVISSTSLNTAIVLGANDLGMHCMDREFSIFSILPPFNVVHAQVLMRSGTGTPVLLSDAAVNVRYDAVADAAGSINTRSTGKTNFWSYAGSLFGMVLQAGQGLVGYYMPVDDPLHRGAQPMAYDTASQAFTAFGIPITPLDDALNMNTYPLLRISATEKTSGNTIGRLDVVVPVASETDCQTCHKTGGIGSTRSGVAWAVDTDIEVQAKKNILRLHDVARGTTLAASTPVLCAGCHYSPALDLAGTGPAGQQVGKPYFSRVMHTFHGDLTTNGVPLFPPNGTPESTCYQCHPGKITQCARGAMKNAGLNCTDCHGGMASVGAKFPLMTGGSIDGANDGQSRRPWKDLPRCQACHTGDAVNYLTGGTLVPDTNWPFRMRQAYRTGDNSASALLASNKRFAENANTLYRFSRGHGGINCNGCHGSTHAEWPNADATANDNVAATQLQGYPGKVMECTACHAAGTLPATTNGPHGLHNINDSRWYDGGHDDSYEANPAGCQACHGRDLTGTPLAKTTAARAFTVDGRAVSMAKGNMVSCNRCHSMP